MLYFYRCHENQLTSAKNQQEYDKTYKLAIQKHLARFNIFAEERTIETFFPILAPLQNSIEKQKLTELVQQILAIKIFYGYQGIHQQMKYKLLSSLYYQYYHFYKKKKKLFYFLWRYGLIAFYFVCRVKISKIFIVIYSFFSSLRFLPKIISYF